MRGPAFNPNVDRRALRRSYELLMALFPGETPEDAAARRALQDPFSKPARLRDLRARTAAADKHLVTLGIDREERIALMRSALPDWASFVAAEVAYGRPPVEDDFWFKACAAVGDRPDE